MNVSCLYIEKEDGSFEYQKDTEEYRKIVFINQERKIVCYRNKGCLENDIVSCFIYCFQEEEMFFFTLPYHNLFF